MTSGSSGLRLQSAEPQAEQYTFEKPSGGSNDSSSSSPDVMRSDPGTMRPEMDAAVPVRRWQRLQWQYPAETSGSDMSKRTPPHRQPPVSMPARYACACRQCTRIRTALISDIHGNAIALEAVLADLERDPVDQVVCLGDALQGGCQPAQVFALLSRLDCPTVLGNADAFVLDETAGEEKPTEKQLDVREWTRAQLGEEGLAYVKTFRPRFTVSIGGGRELLAFHGSPDSYDDIILPHLDDDEFRRLLGTPRSDFLAGGHVHLQWLRRFGESTFVNPGSVGLSYDHAQPEGDFLLDAFAAYARLDVAEDRFEIAFRRVPFARDDVLGAVAACGMPHAQTTICLL
jgi:predicted phosphodiesterase